MMFIKAFGISLGIAGGFVLVLALIDFYNTIPITYRQSFGAGAAFALLVVIIYAILWLGANPMPDSED